MTETDIEIALLKQSHKNHEDICTERYQRISSDTTEIKNTLTAMRADMKESVERIHDKIDAESVARAEGDQQNKNSIGATKVWILGAVVTGVLALLAFMAPDWVASIKGQAVQPPSTGS